MRTVEAWDGGPEGGNSAPENVDTPRVVQIVAAVESWCADHNIGHAVAVMVCLTKQRSPRLLASLLPTTSYLRSARLRCQSFALRVLPIGGDKRLQPARQAAL